MSKIITSEILVAYSQCPRKAFLLLCTKERGTPHEYTEILEQQRQTNQRKYLDMLRRKNVDVQFFSTDNLKNKHQFLTNAILQANRLAAECAILSKVRTHSALGHFSYEPTIFVGTHSIKKEQKLELLFVSHVLEQVQGKRPVSGRIIGLDDKSHKVKLENSLKTLRPFLEPLQEWAATPSPEPPPLILNKHCSVCRFRDLCRTKAEQEDNLSLLDGISTPKAINKYEKKGLFTVKQLSYTFKPRKRKKRAKNPPPVTHKPELRALAIREGKIYLQELPELTRQPVELFLDIEGVPDQQFYYLIGLLVCQDETAAYHSFWADTPADEAQMWQQFLVKVNQYPDAPVYHYGSFEPRALTKLAKRYDTDGDSLTKRLVNVNKHIFGKVYFPVYSNRLKEIGAFVGSEWTAPNASGLQSLVWWHHWNETGSGEYKDILLSYNQEDCQALKLLTDELYRIRHLADTLSEVDFANRPKQKTTEVGKQVHRQFKTILDFADANYHKKKISFRPDSKKEGQEQPKKKKQSPKKGWPGQRKVRPKPTKVVQVSLRKTCPKHDNMLLRPTKKACKRLVIDIVLIKNGLKKTITEYTGFYGYCSECNRYYLPPDINKYYKSALFGRGFKAWVTYQRVSLRISYKNIVKALSEQFNENVALLSVVNCIKASAKAYQKTEEEIIQRLLNSPFIHADETPISIRGTTQYVWVFTSDKYVIFKLRETREATIVHEFLADYSGILISDFYPGYASVKCRQQKCWVHLIRDLNNDLWQNPYDVEFEKFILEVKNLFVPIMETIQKYGLKKRNLNKFKKIVDKFYKDVIIDRRYKSDLVIKYQKRFTQYQDSLFTFLEEDGIPWHNNTAEAAIWSLALQRRISKSFFESVTHDYLVLLGIKESCRLQGQSFFKFLFSGETCLR